MEIKINGEPVEINLQGEENAFEVIENLEYELARNGQVLLQIAVNGEQGDWTEGDLAAVAVEDLKSLELMAESASQVLLDSLIEVSNYLERSLSFFQELHSWEDVANEEQENFREGLSWMVEMFEIVQGQSPSMAHLLFGNGYKDVLDRFRHYEDQAVKGLNLPEIKELLSHTRERINEVLSQIQEANLTAEDLHRRLDDFLAEVDLIQDELAQVSPQLQEGKDSEGFSFLHQAVERLQQYLKLMPALDQSQLAPLIEVEHEEADTLAQLNALIIELLNQLVEAMEQGDSVSISDLCDYELPEAIQILPEAVHKLKSKLS